MKKLLSQYGGLKKEIYILFVGNLVTSMGSFVWPMLTFFLTVRLGLSDTRATMLIAFATLVSLPASLLGGKMADRFSRKKIIIAFDLITVSLYILAAFLPMGYWTAGIIFAASLGQTMESPSYNALTADYSVSAQREKACSLSYLGFNLGFIVGAAVSGVLFQKHLWLAFLLNALSVLVSTLLIAFFVHPENAVTAGETQEEAYTAYEMPVEGQGVWHVLRSRRVVLYMLLVGCLSSFPGNVVGVLLPLQLKQAMGDYGAAIYGYLNSLNGFVVIVATPIFTVLLRHFTEIPKTAAGLLLFGAGMVLFSGQNAVPVLLVGMTVFTLGEVITVLGKEPYASRRIPASHRGRIGGISSVMQSVFSSLTQFFISLVLLVTGSNYVMVWMIFVGLCALASCLYGLLYPMDRRAFPALYARGKQKIGES